MAKMTKNINFKNFSFRVTTDEVTNEKRIMIIEETKDDTIYTDFDDVLDMFEGEEGLSMSIKIERNLGE